MSFNNTQGEVIKMQKKIKNKQTKDFPEAEKLLEQEVSSEEVCETDYGKLEEMIPEVKEIQSFDHKSDFYSLMDCCGERLV